LCDHHAKPRNPAEIKRRTPNIMESSNNPPTNQPAREVLQVVVKKPFADIEPLVSWLKKNSENYLVGEHPPAKQNTTHCHIMIEGLQVSRQALSKQVTKYSPGRGQNFISSQTQETRIAYNLSKLCVYIIKGHVEYHKSSTFTPEQITEWAAEWVEPLTTKGDQAAKPMMIIKKKPQTKYEMCNEIADAFPEDLLLGWKTTGTAEERSRIVQAIIEWANIKHKAMNAYMVADFYDIIMCKCYPERYSNMVCDIINRRHKV